MKMRIHKEGYPVIALVFALLGILITVMNIFFPMQSFFHFVIYISATIFYFFVIRFFRNPIRTVVPNDEIVLSGADGKVVVIEQVNETEYFNAPRLQLSVFMSPTNVHVNWYPVSGIIKYFRHNQGSYFIASKPKSSTENERTSLVIETPCNREIMFRQIAGTVARRIVCYAKEGKKVSQGDDLGIIKFGSRFDFFLPLDAEIQVGIGEKVVGNETIIARLPKIST
jgi:phosphatidylserine decarboxylase